MIRIGRVEIANPVVVAPMSGITDRPFRRLAQELGAELSCTEMASAVALVRQGRQTCELTRVWPDEHPISVQLMGREPAIMAEAARIAVADGADIVDINMGCPVDKVAKKVCAGAGLARDLPVAVACADAMVRAVHPVPVTVKMRLGWDDGTRNCVELARALEDVGVAAVAVHGRTRVQGYGGLADWDHITKVVEAVSIPVFGSGDIRSAADAARRMETGCAGVLLARGMMGNPWLIHQCSALLTTGEHVPDQGWEDHIALCRRLVDHVVEHYGERLGVRLARKFVSWAVRGCPGAARLRDGVQHLDTRADLDRYWAELLALDPAGAEPLAAAV
ncbi:MAG TPA: tRNA dihydrouridine synthase DusB [Candidatus Dormibacteraeota bacterium]|jgi:nifR3 family TIM-barrel protein|nr:tRNA dihydrouridine synthase DusB [Candidatus Dormibacteraeota bacterium]